MFNPKLNTMKRFTMVLTALIVAFGFYLIMVKSNPDGVILMIFGSLCFLLLATTSAPVNNPEHTTKLINKL